MQCNNSVHETAAFLTQHQLKDETPVHVLIDSLRDVQLAPPEPTKPDLFAQTPPEILSHIFSFNGPLCWGRTTRVNRECRVLAKRLLSRIHTFDFSFFFVLVCDLPIPWKLTN